MESLRTTVASWWREPAVADPPPPFRRDWALVGVLEVTALLEGLLGDHVI